VLQEFQDVLELEVVGVEVEVVVEVVEGA